MNLAHALENRNTRLLAGVLIGLPVTFFSSSFIIPGLLSIGLVADTEPLSLAFSLNVLIFLLALFGFLGLAGAWVRVFVTAAYLSAHSRTRKAIALSLGFGTVAAGAIAAILAFAPGLWPYAFLFAATATLGWFLLDASCLDEG